MGEQNDILADMLLLVGVVFILAWLFMTLNKRRKRNRGPNLQARAHLEKLREEGAARTDMDSLKVEIEQLTRRMSSTLDNKAARIEALLDEAEQTIARLEQLRASPSPPSPAVSMVSQPVEPAQSVAPSLNESTPMPSVPPSATDALSSKVHALADQGLPPEAIAKELDEYIGKIELILSLRRA